MQWILSTHSSWSLCELLVLIACSLCPLVRAHQDQVAFQITNSTKSDILSSNSKLQPLYDLVNRQSPDLKDLFLFELVSNCEDDNCGSNNNDNNNNNNNNTDCFTLAPVKNSGKIKIICSSISACSRGLYTYFTEIAHVDIFWTGSRLDISREKAPSLSNAISRSSIVKWR